MNKFDSVKTHKIKMKLKTSKLSHGLNYMKQTVNIGKSL